MMYHNYNNDEELEPRVIPKPASKLDCFAVPSVPEVSLIFDKPLDCKVIDRIGFHPSSAEANGSVYKKNVTSPLRTNGSYAAWREENYLQKSLGNTECRTAQSVDCNENYNMQSEGIVTESLKRSKGTNYILTKDLRNSAKCNVQETRNNESCKSNCHIRKDNAMYIEERQVKNQCDHRINYANSISNVSRTNSNNFLTNGNKYSPVHERKLVAHNSEQHKMFISDSIKEPAVQNLPIESNTLKRNEIQLPQYLGQQSYNPYFNVNTYPFPQLQPYPNHNTDTQETVKNLLQIINSQNEQIKSLQVQVDRLLIMQEECCLKEKKSCSCSQVQQKNEKSAQSNDTLGASNYAIVPQYAKRDTYQSESVIDEKKEILYDDERMKDNEAILSEGQSKKTFMEQKVSIGVMTSFEFTVQNSPFSVDMEQHERNDGHQKENNFQTCNAGVPLRDTNDSLRRYKNSFTRMPSAQLENIVEDSESYMSSSQQQSSSLNASVSLKDLEKQTYVDNRKGIDTRKDESPRSCKSTTNKMNHLSDSSAQKHLERISNEKAKNAEIMKTPIIQAKTKEYDVPINTNRKVDIPCNRNQHAKVNMQKENNSSRQTNNFVNSSTGHYKNHQPEEQVTLTKRCNYVEDSLILNSGDLRINERPPSPEPSIHVDMHEYSSDEDSEKVKRSSKVGWTFYNNVLGQVNQLLQNSAVQDDQQQTQTKANHQIDRDETDNRAVLDTVKVATLEQLKKLGISLSENPEAKDLNNSNKMAFDLSFYPRLDYQTNVTSAVNETNTSMHMKALALKYLTDEQLAEMAIQRQGSTSVKHLMVSNVQGTNMSFATMRYLERYQLLPGKNNVHTEDISKVQVEAPQKTDLNAANPKNSPALQRFPFNQTPRTTCPSKILDISTLKQQPKLL